MKNSATAPGTPTVDASLWFACPNEVITGEIPALSLGARVFAMRVKSIKLTKCAGRGRSVPTSAKATARSMRRSEDQVNRYAQECERAGLLARNKGRSWDEIRLGDRLNFPAWKWTYLPFWLPFDATFQEIILCAYVAHEEWRRHETRGQTPVAIAQSELAEVLDFSERLKTKGGHPKVGRWVAQAENHDLLQVKRGRPSTYLYTDWGLDL